MAEYIDREATVESLNALKPFLRDKGQVQLLRRVMNHIGKIPAADVVPVVHGRWEKHGTMHGFVYCSVCKDVYLDAEWLADGKWTYCPNCGSRMDGE